MTIGMSQGVSIWGSVFGYWGNDLSGNRTSMHDGVESIDWICGVFHDTLSAIGFNQRVRSGHNISGAGFLLALVIAGDGILDSFGGIHNYHTSINHITFLTATA